MSTAAVKHRFTALAARGDDTTSPLSGYLFDSMLIVGFLLLVLKVLNWLDGLDLSVHKKLLEIPQRAQAFEVANPRLRKSPH